VTLDLHSLDDAQDGLEYIRAFLTGLDPTNHWPHKPNLERVVRNCLHKLDQADNILTRAIEAAARREHEAKHKKGSKS
jgi:hypothetical protein